MANPQWSDVQVAAGRKITGKYPTDRGKLRVKRSTRADGRGGPLAVALAGANVPDSQLVVETLDAIPIERPELKTEDPQHLCLDKGYAGVPVDHEVRQRGCVPHVPRKANEPPKPKHRRGKPRRWKVEQTQFWLNRAQRLPIPWKRNQRHI